MISEERLRQLIRQEIDAYAFPAIGGLLDTQAARISALERRITSLHQTAQEARSALESAQVTIATSRQLLRQHAARRAVSYLTPVQ